MKADIYNAEGKVAGKMDLPEKVFGLKWNADLVHQVVTSLETSRRANTAQVKDRGAVRGGGKKPWRQKGTGRARHGSSRSPIWRGGGVTHGPTNERNYERKVNKAMKLKALGTVLSRKQKDGEIVLLNKPEWSEIKTKQAMTLLNNLATSKLAKINYRSGRRTLLALPERNDEIAKSFRNVASVLVTETRNLNPVDVLTYRYVVLVEPEKSLAVLEQRFAK